MQKILGKTIIYPTIFFTGILLIIALNTVSQAEKVLPHFMQLPLVWVLPGVVLFTLAFMAIYCKWKRLRCLNCIIDILGNSCNAIISNTNCEGYLGLLSAKEIRNGKIQKWGNRIC